ncbi:MAG: glycoside hydrolase family 3 protein, partial [Acidimicrobiia bacterium]|nr:glycoside hydrolase family 3 protein [Acidimicrobiia bacterium]
TTTTTVEVAGDDVPLYLDPDAAIDDRIEDLIGRMTLDEKIGQMTLVAQAFVSPSQIGDNAIGAVLSGGGGAPEPNTPAAWIEMITAFQDAALSTRLGIPILYGSDAVHGHNNLLDAVIFPHNVGLGATRSPDLVERIGRATAVETAATGVSWNYSPVLAVPQDIRWGRTYEAFGESTELVTELGVAMLRGLQGDDLAAPDTVLGTPKHFVGDGATEWGSSTSETYWIDQGDARISEEELRSVHLAPYVDAVEAGALSIMASYSSFQGRKLHAHRELLTDVLKGELGFEGFVVSDWAGIDQIEPTDYSASVVAAINAGIDMNMVPGTDAFIDVLREAVDRGDVPIERIDDAVRRILRAKFALGLFEQPYPDPALLGSIGSPAHRDLAEEAVARSLVLLVNDGETLPVEGQTILVAGAGADDIGRQSGGWTIEWQGGVGPITEGSTILDGIRRHAGPDTTLVFEPRGRFDATDRGDVGIVVVGELPYAEGVGDTSRPVVRDHEVALVLDIRERVDRLVVVVVSGRPVVLGEIAHTADAVVAAWLPGSEGAAVAAPLFGAAPFTGLLPFAWPRSTQQLPLGHDTGTTGCSGPLFPYGHGLTAEEPYRPTECEETS